MQRTENENETRFVKVRKTVKRNLVKNESNDKYLYESKLQKYQRK